MIRIVEAKAHRTERTAPRIRVFCASTYQQRLHFWLNANPRKGGLTSRAHLDDAGSGKHKVDICTDSLHLHRKRTLRSNPFPTNTSDRCIYSHKRFRTYF